MKHPITMILAILCLAFMQAEAQDLPTRMEDLSALQFKEAVRKSSKTVILPIGVLEKHGPHMPLGTDVFTAREMALRAAEEEYAVVFPWYYFSQINEAKHQPGTIAYSPELEGPAGDSRRAVKKRFREDHHRERTWRQQGIP